MIGTLVVYIRRLQPQVVVTFDQGGIYGHPDHKAVHRYTTEAFLAAGDPAKYPEATLSGPALRVPARLFYVTIPRGIVQRLAKFMVDRGVRLEEQGFDPETMGVPDEEVTTAIDVRSFMALKRRAIEFHKTQITLDNPITSLPPELSEEFFATEHFIQGRPAAEGEGVSDDLLQGIEG